MGKENQKYGPSCPKVGEGGGGGGGVGGGTGVPSPCYGIKKNKRYDFQFFFILWTENQIKNTSDAQGDKYSQMKLKIKKTTTTANWANN